MLSSLEYIRDLDSADEDLINDLKIIINKISEDKFIQAVLSFQQLKPKYKQTKLLQVDTENLIDSSIKSSFNLKSCLLKTKLQKDQSLVQKGSVILKLRNSISLSSEQLKIHQISRQKCLKSRKEILVQQDNLRKQFQRKYHPFRKIIEGFVFIIQNKYKNLIDQRSNQKIEKIQALLTADISVIQQLFIRISQPYESMYTLQNPEEMKAFKDQMNNFVKVYINTHQKISQAVRKIMRHFSKKSKTISSIVNNFNDFVYIDSFKVPADFQIDGCYVQSMNCLMQFAETPSASMSLKKLQELRLSIIKDVDLFHQTNGQIKEREMSADIQIEIFKFIISKLKGWIPEIFAQIKFLEVIYGDESINVNYDIASYIYAQLCLVFDILEMESFEKKA